MGDKDDELLNEFISYEPRRAGKTTRRNLVELDDEEYQRLASRSVNALRTTPTTTTPPSLFVFEQVDPRILAKGTVIRWKSKNIFSYAGIWTGTKWFITGKGEFYGGNEFTHDQMAYILKLPEVDGVEVAHEWRHLE